MNTLAILGSAQPQINYIDRPTVKVIIKKGDSVLLLNQGLLPGGGVDKGESDFDAIAREVSEELGATVDDINELGTVIQYRNYLGRKYCINGYVAVLKSEGGNTNPQDEGESNFIQKWLSIKEAKSFVESSIQDLQLNPQEDDSYQGKLYNLQTTIELLNALDNS